jgi:predicted ATPase
MPQLKSITIEGYKSIKKLTDFKMRPLNVLIGANGAGKSNFISLFRLLPQMYEQQLQRYVKLQGGAKSFLHIGAVSARQIHCEFYFASNGYKFTLSPTTDNTLIFDNESVWFTGYYAPASDRVIGKNLFESNLKVAADSFSAYVKPAIQSWRLYHFHDTSESAKVKQTHGTNDNLRLKVDAENLAAYVRMLKEKHTAHYQQIIQTIRLVAPFFDEFLYRPDIGEYIELEWTQIGNPDTPFKAYHLSDGTLRFICLAVLLLQPTELLPDTVIIDEPELGLHPYAISVLADIFTDKTTDRCDAVS